MNLGPHADFIIASYAVTALVVAGLIADMESQMARGAQNPGARELAAAF